MLQAACPGRCTPRTAACGDTFYARPIVTVRMADPVPARGALGKSHALSLTAHDDFAARTATAQRIRSRILLRFAGALWGGQPERRTPSTLPIDGDRGVGATERIVADVQHVRWVAGPLTVAPAFSHARHAGWAAVTTRAGGAGLAPAGIDHVGGTLAIAERSGAEPGAAILRSSRERSPRDDQAREHRQEYAPRPVGARQVPAEHERRTHGRMTSRMPGAVRRLRRSSRFDAKGARDRTKNAIRTHEGQAGGPGKHYPAAARW